MLLLGLVLVGSVAQAQETATPPAPMHKQAPVATVDTKTPVSEAEARATFKKIVANIPAIIGKSITIGQGPIPDSTKPVTKDELLAEFDFLYNSVKPEFKYTPQPVWYDPKVITIRNSSSKKTIDKMIKWGFVARVCPLATSKTETISLDDFAYTVGFFVSRLGELTHMPEPKNTPILEPG
jgi:hypothetical protein